MLEVSQNWRNIFASEEDFLNVMEIHDRLIQDCALELITFDEFMRRYKGFYGYYALDGHESDDSEWALFEKYSGRIEPHAEIAENVLSLLCADEDAEKQSYIEAGRFGSGEALRRIREIHEKYFKRIG